MYITITMINVKIETNDNNKTKRGIASSYIYISRAIIIHIDSILF